MPSRARPVLLAVLTTVVGLLAASPALAGTPQTLTYTVPGTHSWVVPPGVGQVEVTVLGAGGGQAAGGSCTPGAGGSVKATISVTPGEELKLAVGGAGGDGSGGTGGAGGANGGGIGGKAGSGTPAGGGGGGGWSGVSAASVPLVVAGGGGGCGAGAGSGGNDEGDGSDGLSPSHSLPHGGGAGTGSGPGAGGISDDGFDGGDEGASLQGGAGFGADGDAGGGGGGGGGLFGGGGGGGFQPGGLIAGGGGGGSDFIASSVSGATVVRGANSGGGSLAVTYALPGTTVGKAPPGGGAIELFSNAGTWLQVTSTGDRYVVPTGGVVTAWSYASAAGVGTSGLRLVVARGAQPPEGEVDLVNATGSFAVVGRDPALATGAIDQAKGQVDVYPARIPVHAGDLIGAEWSSGMSVTKTDTGFKDLALPGDVLADGGTITMRYSTKLEAVDQALGFGPGPFGYAGLELPLSVQVEPDADGDGWGDLSQDRCPGTFGSREGCPVADLAISQIVAAASAWPQATFAQVVTNAGPDPVPDATVTEALPAGATLVSATTAGGTCTTSGTVTCRLGTLAPGATATITLVVGAGAPGPLSVTATVASQALATAGAAVSGAGDPNAGNDTATAGTVVGAPPGGPAAGAAAGSSAPVPGAAETPKITNLRQSATRWREGRKLAPAAKAGRPRVPTGTTFRFALNEPATVTMTFTRRVPRGNPRRPCTAAHGRGARPACMTTQTLGALHLDAKAGVDAIPFTGRLDSGRRLPPGRISVTLYARDTAGRRAAPESLTFTIVK
jgi:uncharacterized repeat protein (TIGR01451 family)